jgi:MFS transporter, SP family, galactose:H+ symporter
VFIAESAPVKIRGALIVGCQVATVVGIMVAYFVGYGLAASGSWRIMLALSAVVSALVPIALLRLPDTPRWYLMHGRREEALDTLRRADPTADAERSVREIEENLAAEWGGFLREMLRLPYARATVFVVALGFLVQITGINAITYYSPFIFQDIGWQGHFVLLIQAFIEAFSVIATVVSVLIVDRVGRRRTLLIGVWTMVASNALMVALYASGSHFSGARQTLGFIGILFFTAGFNFGFGALVWVCASKSFPARLRTAGASAMLTADLVANLLISRFFLTVLHNLGGLGTFSLFLGPRRQRHLPQGSADRPPRADACAGAASHPRRRGSPGGDRCGARAGRWPRATPVCTGRDRSGRPGPGRRGRRRGAAIAAWRTAGIDEAELASREP